MSDDLLRRHGRRLRWGMVGGGTDSVIGETHRLAARVDNRYNLVAGCLSIDPEIARDSAGLCLIPSDRAYTDYETMAAAEANRTDGVEVVTVCTPPRIHGAISAAFLRRGIDVICEKPMTADLPQSLELVDDVRETGRALMLTHCYTGYPMVRQARAMVRAGVIGAVRVIEADFVSGFFPGDPGAAANHWRFRRAAMGLGSTLGEIGTHAHNLACFVGGRQVTEVSAELRTFVPGREVYDDAQLQLRFEGGATGRSWSTFVATGNEHGLSFRVYGESGGLVWHQESPEELWYQPGDAPVQRLTRGQAGLTPAADQATRLRPGHPEGYVLAFANLYRDFADALLAWRLGEVPDPLAMDTPTVEDGARTMKLLEAALESHENGGVWTDARLEL